MFRTSTLLLLGALLALGCGDDDDTVVTDAGTDATTPEVDGGGEDAGPRPRDSGVDAGPSCTEGCEIVQVVVGHSHACARRENGQVLCWGGNTSGELGDNSMIHEDCSDAGGGPTRADCSARPVVVLDVDATVIGARAGFQTCAITDEDTRCWGLSDVPPPGSEGRQLRYVATPIAGLSPAAEVQASASTTCVRRTDGTVWCTGANGFGQLLGEDDMDRRETVMLPGLSAVVEFDSSAMGAFGCARTASSFQCWGANDGRQLGDGEAAHQFCGLEPQRVDCSRVPVDVEVLDASEIVQVELGARFGCALLENGTVWCWGANGLGQMGDPDLLAPTEEEPNRPAGSSPVPNQVPGLENVTQIAAGPSHACALLESGEVWCWGNNQEGQVGDGLEPGSEGHLLCSDGVFCVRQPRQVVGGLSFVSIAAGYQTNCGIATDGEVYCWGYNNRRQVGQMDRQRRSSPTRIAGLN